MAYNTKIEWATHSWNPWEGCTKVSPGCANCYAEARNLRFFKGANWGKGKPRRRTSVSNWKQPLRWNSAAAHCDGERPPRIFPSLCDWLDEEVPIEWLADFLKLIHETPNLDWLLLTKRPASFLPRIRACFKLISGAPGWSWLSAWESGAAPANVWIGVSVEDQQRADERIPHLLKIPATVRFISAEPLLGPIDLRLKKPLAPSKDAIHWLIPGGESGPGARPCHVAWLRSLVEQAKSAGVRCFVKQLGSQSVSNSGFALKLADKGGNMEEWPEDLRVRAWPEQ